MADEIELKLSLPPAQLERLRRHPFVRANAQARATRKRLLGTYFDTADFLLRDRRIALRLRTVGDQQVQTVKIALDSYGELAGRPPAQALAATQHLLEFEAISRGERPDPELIEDETLRRFFRDEKLAGRLEPVFETDIDRRSLLLRLPDAEIELDLDLGEIRAAGRSEAVSEAELELRSGSPSRLYELALMVSETLAFRLEARSKAERGYALFAGVEPAPNRGRKLALTREMTVAESFELLAGGCLAHLRDNEAAVLSGGDPEGVHQLRVAVRRLRALVGLMKPVMTPEAAAFLKQELRWLQQALGNARDWDVFALETLKPLHARLPEEAGLAGLDRAVEAARARAYDTARAALGDARYARLQLRLALWLHEGGWRPAASPGSGDPTLQPIAALAETLLSRRAKALRKTARRCAGGGETALHEVRIAAKKLRYAIEFFRGLYSGKAVRRYHAKLVELQDTLGTLNDALVGHRLIEELESAGRHDPAVAVDRYATGLVVGWQAARIEADLGRYAAAWRACRKAKPFWGG